MINIHHRDQYAKSVIAQCDSGGYDPSGWVAVYDPTTKLYALASFGHCSCYGTWEALCGGGIGDYFTTGDPKWNWEGTKRQLIKMIIGNLDPDMPTREISPKDYDSEYLTALYAELTKFFVSQSK